MGDVEGSVFVVGGEDLGGEESRDVGVAGEAGVEERGCDFEFDGL